MAVGVAVEKAKLDAFRVRFAEGVRAWTGGRVIEPELEISAWLRPDDIDDRLMDELVRLQPFGQANPEPRFGLRGVVLRQRPEVFKAVHFRFAVEGAGAALARSGLENGRPSASDGSSDRPRGRAGLNFFNDRKTIQIELIDWRPSGA